MAPISSSRSPRARSTSASSRKYDAGLPSFLAMCSSERIAGRILPSSIALTCARDAPEAVRLCQELLPDVVILDDEMPGGRGIQVLEWIASELPDTRVVMYTLDADVCDVARNLGAGCVLKDANYEVLVRAVRNGAASLPRSAETY